MTCVLVVAEHVRGSVRDVTLELVNAGRDLGEVTVAIIARDPGRMVPGVDVAGVSAIVTVAVGADEFENDVHQQALEALIAAVRPDVVLLGFTVNALEYGPALAAKLELGFASDVHSIRCEDGTVVATRSYYGGKVHAELDFPGCDCVLLMLRPTVWARAEGPGGASVASFEAAVSRPRARHLELLEPDSSDEADIATAEFLIAIGRGITTKHDIGIVASLARRMGATLASSRPLIDVGWMPTASLVGQSGTTVKPKVYLAFGISGAAQHLAGMERSATIIAVNTDREAPIYGVAHFGAIADASAIVAALDKLY